MFIIKNVRWSQKSRASFALHYSPQLWRLSQPRDDLDSLALVERHPTEQNSPLSSNRLRAGRTSEVDLRAKLKDPRVICRGDLAEVARPKCIAHLIKLSVIPDIEAFCAKLKPPLLAEREALKEGEVPIIPAGASQRIKSCVTPCTHGR